MKSHTQVLVIGGGIAGCSLLYHLTRLGVGDCALVEKQELTAGTTWHSAACITHFSHSSFISRLHHRTTRMYEELERETGQPTGFHRTGSIRLALSADQLAEMRRFAGFARSLGIPYELLDPEDVRALHPLVSLNGVRGALHTPTDGWVDAHQSTHAFAYGARQCGAEIYRHTRVTGLRRRSDDGWEVETDRGTIIADTVVNAAGFWGNEMAAMVGVSPPLVAVELSYLVTEGIAEIRALDRELPVLRGLDGSYYLRQERDGMLIGVYEEHPVFWNLDGIPSDFGQEYLPGDLDRIEGSVTAAMARVPVLADAGIRNLICGPAQRTPDFHGLLGPVPECPNLFSYVGFVAGILPGARARGVDGAVDCSRPAGRRPVAIRPSPVWTVRGSRLHDGKGRGGLHVRIPGGLPGPRPRGRQAPEKEPDPRATGRPGRGVPGFQRLGASPHVRTSRLNGER